MGAQGCADVEVQACRPVAAWLGLRVEGLSRVGEKGA